MNTKTTGKDFFLHLGTIAALYVGTIALLNLIFTVINAAFPRVGGYGYYSSTSLSLPVATLIVVFPLYLLLSNILQKGYSSEPARREYAVRKWLIYITLFIAGAVLAGDLITLIYFFLDGRELTVAFFLKVLAVLVVMGAIFGYYTDDLKGRLTGGRRSVWRVGAVMLVLGAIIAGFSVLGTPQSQRLIRYDNDRINDLSSIQWQIVNYWQQKGELPDSLEDLNDPLSGFNVPTDPQTGESYEYERTGDLSFELCAAFNRSTPSTMLRTGALTAGNEILSVGESRPVSRDPFGGASNNWQHSEGRHCFDRTIDPELYPVRR